MIGINFFVPYVSLAELTNMLEKVLKDTTIGETYNKIDLALYDLALNNVPEPEPRVKLLVDLMALQIKTMQDERELFIEQLAKFTDSVKRSN